MGQQYKALRSDALIIHPLDSMTLIFHRSSGITHIVADPVPVILDVMGRTAMTPQAIADQLAAQYELEQGANVEQVVLARLEELCALGLMVRE